MRKIILLFILFCAVASAHGQDANKNAVSATINDSIRTNGQNKITASTLNAILHLINNVSIDSLQAINAINAQKGLTNGIAALSGGTVPTAQLPLFLNGASVINDTSILITLSTGQLDTLVIKGAAPGSSDTISLSNRINASMKYTDTATMLFAYLRYNLGMKYTDTGTMLAPYLLISNFTPTLIGLGNLVNQLQVVNAGGMNSMKVGPFTSIPAPGSGPTIYYAPDSNALYYNNSSAYVKISGGSGTINFAELVAILGYTPTSPTLLADSSGAVRLALVDTASAIRAAIASGGLTFPGRPNVYLNGYGAFVGLNTDSITAGTTNKFFVASDTAGFAGKATQVGLTDTAAAIRTALIDSIATVHTIVGDTSSTLRALIAAGATQVGLTDTAAAIRSAIVASTGVNQATLNDSTAAIRVALSDSAGAVRLAVVDTAGNLRTAMTALATQVGLGDSTGAIRTALGDTSIAIRSALSLYATQIALNDTAAAHRSLIALGATQVGLADTAIAIRTAVTDTAGNLRTAIGLSATQVGLTDTAAAVRTALLDTASNHRTLIATLATQIGLTDTAGAVRIAVVDTASNIRSSIGSLATHVALVDTAAAIRSSIGSAGVTQTALNDTAAAVRTALVDTSVTVRTALLDTAAAIRGTTYVQYPRQGISPLGTHGDSLQMGGIVGAFFQPDTVYTNGQPWRWLELPHKASPLITDSAIATDISGQVWKIPFPTAGGGGSYDSATIYAALAVVRDSVDSIQARPRNVNNDETWSTADSLLYAPNLQNLYARRIKDTSITGELIMSEALSTLGTIVHDWNLNLSQVNTWSANILWGANGLYSLGSGGANALNVFTHEIQSNGNMTVAWAASDSLQFQQNGVSIAGFNASNQFELKSYSGNAFPGAVTDTALTIWKGLVRGIPLSNFSTQLALNDTAAAHRTLIGLSATQVGLADTAAALRTAIASTGGTSGFWTPTQISGVAVNVISSNYINIGNIVEVDGMISLVSGSNQAYNIELPIPINVSAAFSTGLGVESFLGQSVNDANYTSITSPATAEYISPGTSSTGSVIIHFTVTDAHIHYIAYHYSYSKF